MSAVMREIERSKKSTQIDLRRLPALAKREIDHAQLPENYIAAKKALARCAEVDQVKEIADKHSAIAHYAKQIKDRKLLHYAERVYLRALTRIGELLAELPDSKSRNAAAAKYGVSPTDATHAYRMSLLSTRAKDALIERDPPASKNEIAHQGYKLTEKYRPWGGFKRYATVEEKMRTPWGRVERLFDSLRDDFDHATSKYGDGPATEWPSAAAWAAALSPSEAKSIKPMVLKMIEWLDEFEQHLTKG